MKLDLIHSALASYKQYLKSNLAVEHNYKWAVLQRFQEDWSLEKQDLAAMYKAVLSQMDSRSLWGGNHESARSLMLMMLEVQPEFVRQMFRDLFDENKDVILRLDRFGVHCEELMPEVEKQFGRQVSHYHDDWKMLSFYLAFRYPKIYCLYEYEYFAAFAKCIGIQKKPEPFEIGRFFKIMRTLYTVISKDEELMALHKKRIQSETFYQGPSLLLCHDFYYFIGMNQD